jgi:hypothetical protein
VDAEIAEAVRGIAAVAYRPGQGLQARREAIEAEARRTGISAGKVAQIWECGFDCDQVLAEIERQWQQRKRSKQPS